MRHFTHDSSSGEGVSHWETWRYLWKYLWPRKFPGFRLRVVCSLGFLMGAKGVSAWVPVLYKDMVDTLSQRPEKPVLMVTLILSYGLARLMQSVFGELRDLIFVRVAQFSKRSVALDTFTHLHNLSLSFHLDRQTGGLSRVIERGTSGIQFVLSFMLFNILPTVFELLLVSGILWHYFDYRYAVITLLTVVGYVLYTMLITEWRLKYRRKMNKKDEQANTKAVDSLLNYETVKYFGNEGFERDRFDKALKGYEQAAVANQKSLAVLNSGQNLIIAAGSVLLLFLAFRDVEKEILTVGGFVMINTYMLQLFLPLNFLGFVYRQMKQSFVDMDRMFSVSKIAPEVRDSPDSDDIQGPLNSLEFKNAGFSYRPGRKILDGFSLKINAGESLAVVGESGSGKSTLVRLLYRFYDLTEGELLVNGIDVCSLKQDSLRRLIGIVPQDTVLFNDTIKYNVWYGNLDAEESSLQRAADQARISGFIGRLPSGWDTVVGERGLKVSGGEKQRIAIARALLKNPPLLILDEATSSLDTATEKEIELALGQVTQGRTTIKIAHRLSTVVSSDRIIVMKHGKIVEEGSHQKLLSIQGEYRRMWQQQKDIRDPDHSF